MGRQGVDATHLGWIVKTLQGLGVLSVSMIAVDARVQWFNGSVVSEEGIAAQMRQR